MIGINSQILSPAGGSVGVGFAVPVSIARRIVPQLIQYGEVRRPKMGINGLGVDQLRQRGFQLPLETGLYVDAVLPSGSAGQAGIRGTGQNSYGDIIVNIDGEALNNLDDLYRVLDRRKIGDTVQVQILRDNKRQTIPVKLLGTTTTGRTTNQANPRRF
jgi:S1-C subfamily serine protease